MKNPDALPGDQVGRERRLTVPRTNLVKSCLVILFIIMVVIPVVIIWINPFRRTHKLTAKGSMKGIEIALKGYQAEYYRCLLSEMKLPGDRDIPFEGEIMSALMAQSTRYNPKRIRFYDPPVAKREKGGAWRDSSGAWQYRDVWGTPIMIRYDADHDGKTTDPSDGVTMIDATYLLFSGGRDRNLTTWKDNLKSWQ